MRHSFAALILGFALTASAAIRPADLSIGGIEVGTAEPSVIERLGKPMRRVETGEGVELHYPGLVVSVGWLEDPKLGRERRVFSLYGTGTKACTPQGLCPGVPVAAAGRLYGHVQPTRRETGTYLEYQPVGALCWLQVSAPSGVIRALAVACQP